MTRICVALATCLLGAIGGATPASAAEISNADLVAAITALGGAADLVVFPPTAKSPAVVRAATLVNTGPAPVAATLRTPSAYREAIPSLARADVVSRRKRAGGPDDLLVAWEVEIPLFNLKGKLWVSSVGDSVTLDLVEGNFAPGRLAFTWTAVDAATTAMTLEARVNVREGGWLLRRVAGRSRYAEAAMTATAAFVCLRATAARAEGTGRGPPRRPQAPIASPSAAAIDVRQLSAAPLARLRANGGDITAVVRRAPSGRLAIVSVVAPMSGAPDRVGARLAAPQTWHAFPGWKRVEPRAVAGTPAALDVEVEDNIPFVDFDARWRFTTAPAIRAQAISGATRGALFGWDLLASVDGAAATSAIAVLSMHPRLDSAGYVPRRFVEAEPFLEHGLALALAYVDVLSAKEAIEREAQGKQ